MWAAWLAVVLVVLSVVPAVADEPDAAAITPPRLSYLNGSVSFWRPGAEQWTAAQVNTALAPGDQVHTGHLGTVELQVGGRAFVRAWGDTELGLVDQTGQRARRGQEVRRHGSRLPMATSSRICALSTPAGFSTSRRRPRPSRSITPATTVSTSRRT